VGFSREGGRGRKGGQLTNWTVSLVDNVLGQPHCGVNSRRTRGEKLTGGKEGGKGGEIACVHLVSLHAFPNSPDNFRTNRIRSRGGEEKTGFTIAPILLGFPMKGTLKGGGGGKKGLTAKEEVSNFIFRSFKAFLSL